MFVSPDIQRSSSLPSDFHLPAATLTTVIKTNAFLVFVFSFAAVQSIIMNQSGSLRPVSKSDVVLMQNLNNV